MKLLTLPDGALGGYLQFLVNVQKNTVADHPSLYSHLSKWKFHEECFKSAKRAVFTLLCAGGLGITPVEEEELKRRLAVICSKRRLEGEWKLVGYLLQEPLAPGRQLRIVYSWYRSFRPIFGQKKIFLSIYRGLKRVPLDAPQRTPVRRPLRKRGYDDKGQLRSCSLNDIRYWRTPGAPLVSFVVHGKKFLPDWYVTEAELERLELAGNPGGGSRVLSYGFLESYRLRRLLSKMKS
jgi:hypothetical protein